MINPHGTLKTAIIRAIRELTQELGFPPTVREIGARVGNRGVGSIHAILLGLREDGILTWEDSRRRTIRIVREGPSRAEMERWSDEELKRVQIAADWILGNRERAKRAAA